MKCFTLEFVILVFLLAAPFCSAEMKEEEFTRGILPKLENALPSHKFDYVGPLEIRDSTSGETIYLDRIYGFITSNPRLKEAAVTDYVARIAKAAAEADKPISKEDVRLAVRNALSLKRTVDAMGTGTKVAYPRELAGDLVVVPVIDTTSMVKYISQKNLTTLGIDEAQAIDLGKKNLQKIQKPMKKVASIPPHSAIGIIREEYAASRLIFFEDWASIEKQIGGNLIVMAPAFDTVIYGDGSTMIGIDALRTIGMKIAKDSQVPLSSTVVRLKGNHWEVVE